MRRRLRENLRRFGQSVLDAQPKQKGQYSPAQLDVAALHGWTVSLYRAVAVLLREGLPEEALILCRTQVEATLRLAYFGRHTDRLEELTLRAAAESIDRQVGLVKAAAAAGHGALAAARSDDLTAQRAAVRVRARAAGLKRLPKLPRAKAIAYELGLTRLAWTIEYASHFVHSSRIAMATRARVNAPDSYTILTTSPGDPRLSLTLARLTVESLGTATLSAWHVLGLSPGDVLAIAAEVLADLEAAASELPA